MSKQASQKYRKEKDKKSNDKIDDTASVSTNSVKDQSGTKQDASGGITNSYLADNYDNLLK